MLCPIARVFLAATLEGCSDSRSSQRKATSATAAAARQRLDEGRIGAGVALRGLRWAVGRAKLAVCGREGVDGIVEFAAAIVATSRLLAVKNQQSHSKKARKWHML